MVGHKLGEFSPTRKFRSHGGNPRKVRSTAVKAVAKGVRMSPRKVGVVAQSVRGRTVADALTILEHTPRRAALPVKKAIESAKANADHNHNYKPDTLKIVQISVTP